MKKVLSFITAAVMLTSAAGAAVSAYSDPYPLPDMSGMSPRDAMIEAAKSQLGYTEDSSGGSYFSVWTGQRATAPWCSEFVSWCARAAGIPENIIPTKQSSSGFIKFYSGSRFYLPNNGQNHDSCGCAAHSAGYLSIDELIPGDILVFESNSNFSDGPDHTNLFLYAEGDTIHTIDGNSRDCVKYSSNIWSRLHGICRPDYDNAAHMEQPAPPQTPAPAPEPEPSAPSTPSLAENKPVNIYTSASSDGTVTVSWTKSAGADGYTVYLLNNSGNKYKSVYISSGNASAVRFKGLLTGKTYRFKVRPFTYSDGKKVYGSFSDVSKVKIPDKSADTADKTSVSAASPTLSISKLSGYDANLSWKKNDVAYGFEVYSSIYPDKGFVLMRSFDLTADDGDIVTVKLQNILKHDTIYCKVRYYYYVNGKKVYSDYTNTVSTAF